MGGISVPAVVVVMSRSRFRNLRGLECALLEFSCEPAGWPALRQRPVRPQSFIGEVLHEIQTSSEQAFCLRLVCVLGEKPVTLAGAPNFREFFFAEKDVGGIGIA